MKDIKASQAFILFVFSLLICVACSNNSIEPPASLAVNQCFENPLGLYDAEPGFSWNLPQNGSIQKQTAYRIIASATKIILPDSPDLRDSGMVESDQSVLIKYEGKVLASRQHVYLQVQYRDEQNSWSGWSDVNHFELGLLNNNDWKGQWIQMKGIKVFEAPCLWVEADKISHRKDAVFTINKAQFRLVADTAKKIDITAKIKEMVNKGNYILRVSDKLIGNSELPQGEKELFIDYSVSQNTFKKALRQGTFFDLFSRCDFITLKPEYLRKEFGMKTKVKAARLYISARGVFEAYVNSERVAQDYLVPGWTTYLYLRSDRA